MLPMKNSLFIILLVMSAQSYIVRGQDFVKMNHALRAEIGLPVVIHNPAFKEFVQGVAFAHVNYQYRLMGNARFSPTVGLGISANYLDVANFKIVGLNQGGLFSYGGHLQLGVEFIHDESFISSFDVRAGYFFMESRNKQTPTDIKYFNRFQHFFIEPGYSFTIMADERQGFSFHASYAIRDIKFNAHHLMLSELPGFVNANLGAIGGHLNFGIGYKLYLQKQPKMNE